MTQAAKEAGNLCSTGGKHQEALERYTLALTLDPDNITALSNRAKMHLVVRPCTSSGTLATMLDCAISDPEGDALLPVAVVGSLAGCPRILADRAQQGMSAHWP